MTFAVLYVMTMVLFVLMVITFVAKTEIETYKRNKEARALGFKNYNEYRKEESKHITRRVTADGTLITTIDYSFLNKEV